MAKNNTTCRLKDVKVLTCAAFGKITKDVWTKAEEHVIKTEMKYHLKKIDTSVHQPLPNMVQRLFADVINDAI